MSRDRVYVGDELYLSLETVAELYQVRTVWLRSVYDLGLLGSGVDSGTGICIAAIQMDRVATIVRMHDVLGLDIDMISLTLEDR